MKKILPAILFLISIMVYAQDKKFEELQTDNEWSDGSIMTNDGKELKGLIRFDDRNSLLNYVNGNDSKSFTPRNVAAFEFFDAITKKQRIFYSVEYDNPKTGSKAPLFFEVLKDFGAFAVLAKMDPVKVAEHNSSNYPSSPYGTFGYSSSTVEISQLETIYFMNERGGIEPYFQVTRKVVDRAWYDREKKKNKFVDRHVIEKYFSEDELDAMKDFAEKNDLAFQVKDDFIKILDFSVTLRNEKKN
jgi:hypothetical protein